MNKQAKYGKHNLCALLADLHKRGRRLNIADAMTPIDSGAGSRFGEDVIRITGSDEFCEAVLSRLADLIEVERSDATRLDASWSEVKSNDGRFAKGQGGNSIYLRMAIRGSGSNDSPMAVAHRATRARY
jgi:hypothetical protein